MFTPLVQKFKSIMKMDDANKLPLNARINAENPLYYDDVTDEEIMKQNEELKYQVYDCIRFIKDPEKPATLEDLKVVYEDGITVSRNWDLTTFLVDVEFAPTVPHCNLATLIGLCIRVKLQRSLLQYFKLTIKLKKGSHNTEHEVNKQINDKERVAAAMENPSLQALVEKCIEEPE